MSVPVSAADESPRGAPSGFAPKDDAVETPRGQSDVAAAFRERADKALAPVRVSCVVPLGTSAELGASAEESVNEAAEPSDSASMRPSDVVPRSPSPHENRAAVRVSELGLTRQGPTFGSDEDDEATTVDATAGLSFEEREALGLRVHSLLEETRPHGTPLPEPVRAREEPGGEVEALAAPAAELATLPAQAATPLGEPAAPPAEAAAPPAEAAAPPVESAAALEEPARGVDEAEVAREQRLIFKQTMLLGLPMRETPPPPAPAGNEPALMASVVRVVGPPTQPPPRRSRRVGAVSSAPAGEPELPPDHEAFVLTNPIASPDVPRKVVPDAAPPPSVSPSPPVPPSRAEAPPVPPSVRRSRPGPPSLPSLPVSVSRASLPGVMLPPAPAARDYEIDSAPLHSKTMPPLRATIEPPGSLARTRPPAPYGGLEPEFDELPVSDPFAGFVAPPPSLLQRWLVVIVVALAVVGLCSLAAIAFGFLGKTGW